MRRLLVCTLIPLNLYALPALAEDKKAFNGFSSGIEAGIQRNKARLTAPGNVRFQERNSGFTFRDYLGYDVQGMDGFVFGVEFGASNGGPTIKATNGPATINANPGWTFDASARVGYTPDNKVLFYGRVGYANAKLKITASNSTATPSTFLLKKRRGGLMYGTGAEFAISHSFSVRLEYRRTRLNEVRTQQLQLGTTFKF